MRPIQVVDVPGLGQPALVVNTSGPKLLLLDADLEHDERMEFIGRFFPDEST